MYLYDDIVKVGCDVLRTKCEEVAIPLSDEDKNTLKEMRTYLENGYDDKFVKSHNIRPGVGLAAPQVNVAKRMLCILAYNEKGELFDLSIINPKIISYSVDLTYLDTGEGCLSVEEEHKGYIHRYKKIKVKCYLYNHITDECELTTLQFKGYLSIVFQHEYDHLNGILFFDHINQADPFFVPENSTPVVFKK